MPKGVYVRKPKNQKQVVEAEAAVSIRPRRKTGVGGHPGKPVWAHEISPFQKRIRDPKTGNVIGIGEPQLSDGSMGEPVGMDRDQLAAVRGGWMKARKREKVRKSSSE